MGGTKHKAQAKQKAERGIESEIGFWFWLRFPDLGSWHIPQEENRMVY